jgi:16S rRNA (guanine(966)-N(2))-methyltransferase RsmD
MRVIAGTARGRKLASLPGNTTRPIADRVKTALFSILYSQGVLPGSRWLDLFGGTGAVGIEALSRGAGAVVFVERSSDAVRVIGQNLRHTGLAAGGRSHVVRGDAFSYLQQAGAGPFDIIYVAPPQYQGLWQQALRAIDRQPELLAEEGQVIVQIHPKEDEPALVLEHLERYDQRQYGSTRLIFFARRPLGKNDHSEPAAAGL